MGNPENELYETKKSYDSPGTKNESDDIELSAESEEFTGIRRRPFESSVTVVSTEDDVDATFKIEIDHPESQQDDIDFVSKEMNDNVKELFNDYRFCKVTVPDSGDVVSRKSLNELIRVYDGMSTVPANETNGAAYEHAALMKTLYPRDFLVLLGTIFDLKQTDDIDALEKKERALITLKAVIQMIEEVVEMEEITPYEAFSLLYSQWTESNHNIIEKIEEAKKAAIDCISYFEKINKSFASKRYAGVSGLLMADTALSEHNELEKGMELSAEFKEKLIDKKTKVVVVSLDFNSTLNMHESYATPPLLHMRYRAQVDKFVLKFRRMFPDKKLVIVINTGRPGDYVWGVIEASSSSMRENREVAFAESGGAMLDKGVKGKKCPTIEVHPSEWKLELDNIRDFLLGNISEQEVTVEPKLSMLSIKIDQQNEKCHTAVDGTVVTPAWMKSMLRQYFRAALNLLDTELKYLVDQLVLMNPDAKGYGTSLIQAFRNEDIGQKKQALAKFQPLAILFNPIQVTQLDKIVRRLDVLEEMFYKNLLEVKYNPTAGFVDIGHKYVNKYSSLMKFIRETKKVKTEEILFVQVGDSNTDIIPTEKTGPGEPNEGADDAFLVAVSNCSESLHESMENRSRSGRGMWTYNESIMGVTAFFKGLNVFLEEEHRLNKAAFRVIFQDDLRKSGMNRA
jgi:hypothetical protein